MQYIFVQSRLCIGVTIQLIFYIGKSIILELPIQWHTQEIRMKLYSWRCGYFLNCYLELLMKQNIHFALVSTSVTNVACHHIFPVGECNIGLQGLLLFLFGQE